MRALKFKLLTLAFFVSCTLAFAQDRSEKKFHQEYKVDKNTKFEISNKFGEIDIVNTTSDIITIDAEVIVESNSKSKADNILSKIDVEISQEGNLVKAKTDIDDINTSGKTNFEINYKISMPAYLDMNLSNKYGGVNINELEGNVNIAVKYGSLNINKMLDGNEKPLSSIELGYCNKSTINEINWAKLIVKYSKINILKGRALVISSKYSKLDLGNFSSIVGEAGYDDYEIDYVGNLVMNSKYSEIEVGVLGKKLTLDNKYGNVTVNKVKSKFEAIDVVSKYAKIDLGIDPEASYILDAQANYAGISYPEMEIQERIKDNNELILKGRVGKDKNTKATVNVKSSYGGIDLD